MLPHTWFSKLDPDVQRTLIQAADPDVIPVEHQANIQYLSRDSGSEPGTAAYRTYVEYRKLDMLARQLDENADTAFKTWKASKNPAHHAAFVKVQRQALDARKAADHYSYAHDILLP